ncbi:MAG: hypothetical protein WB511_06635 [Nitrososphaeraceae archaeon]
MKNLNAALVTGSGRSLDKELAILLAKKVARQERSEFGTMLSY